MAAVEVGDIEGLKYCWCNVCLWAKVDTSGAMSDEALQTLCVLHTTVRHPALYSEAVGRSAEEGAFEFRSMLADPEIAREL